MDNRTRLSNYLKEIGKTPQEYAKDRGVSPASLYKFLGGKDIRLSTWERLKPPPDFDLSEGATWDVPMETVPGGAG